MYVNKAHTTKKMLHWLFLRFVGWKITGANSQHLFKNSATHFGKALISLNKNYKAASSYRLKYQMQALMQRVY
jgi:hypothetical protein